MRRDARWLVAVACAACHAQPVARAPDDPITRMALAWRIRDASLVGASPPTVTLAEELRFVDPRDGYRWPAGWRTLRKLIAVGDVVVGIDDSKPGLVAARRPLPTDERVRALWQLRLGDELP